jgi:DNA processing protein
MQIQKLSPDKFPKALLEIPQPPKELYVFGELPPEDYVYLCIVGSRKFTSYGREACEKIIAGLKGYPIVIVSGFAMGIDSIAHRKAMQVGLRTLVFPGSGLSKESIYPKTNLKLMDEILENYGCFISEFEPNFKATLWSFPQRNRLMAGISKAVLIIEAEEKSGTLITARLATDYNRDVMVIPGSIFAQNSKGTNNLLKLGAIPITCAEDVLQELGFEIKNFEEDKQKKLFDESSSDEKIVLKLLREPLARDELILKMKMPIQSANSLLSIMEIKGLIKEEFGEIRLIN